jgi:hypothetical protein
MVDLALSKNVIQKAISDVCDVTAFRTSSKLLLVNEKMYLSLSKYANIYRHYSNVVHFKKKMGKERTFSTQKRNHLEENV